MGFDPFTWRPSFSVDDWMKSKRSPPLSHYIPKEPYLRKCEECGREYETYYPATMDYRCGDCCKKKTNDEFNREIVSCPRCGKEDARVSHSLYNGYCGGCYYTIQWEKENGINQKGD